MSVWWKKIYIYTENAFLPARHLSSPVCHLEVKLQTGDESVRQRAASKRQPKKYLLEEQCFIPPIQLQRTIYTQHLSKTLYVVFSSNSSPICISWFLNLNPKDHNLPRIGTESHLLQKTMAVLRSNPFWVNGWMSLVDDTVWQNDFGCSVGVMTWSGCV